MKSIEKVVFNRSMVFRSQRSALNSLTYCLTVLQISVNFSHTTMFLYMCVTYSKPFILILPVVANQLLIHAQQTVWIIALLSVMPYVLICPYHTHVWQFSLLLHIQTPALHVFLHLYTSVRPTTCQLGSQDWVLGVIVHIEWVIQLFVLIPTPTFYYEVIS